MCVAKPPAFDKSAKRHLADATHLHSAGRDVTADHLCGLAAECALKALVLIGLGGRLDKGFVHDPDGNAMRKHVGGGKESTWSAVSSLASGRLDAEVSGLLVGDPFHDWDVSDRYSDGAHITRAVLDRHLDGAKRATRALEAAFLSNMQGGS